MDKITWFNLGVLTAALIVSSCEPAEAYLPINEKERKLINLSVKVFKNLVEKEYAPEFVIYPKKNTGMLVGQPAWAAAHLPTERVVLADDLFKHHKSFVMWVLLHEIMHLKLRHGEHDETVIYIDGHECPASIMAPGSNPNDV